MGNESNFGSAETDGAVNLIDKLVAYVSPERALRRRMARQLLKRAPQMGGYDGARRTRPGTKKFNPHSGSPDADTLPDLPSGQGVRAGRPPTSSVGRPMRSLQAAFQLESGSAPHCSLPTCARSGVDPRSRARACGSRARSDPAG